MQEHGSFSIERAGKILILRAFGAWNYQTAKRFCDEFKSSADLIKDKPWACLVDLLQWELTTPDAKELFEQKNIWSCQNNQRHEAVVCQRSLQRQVVARSHASLTNVDINFFGATTEAYTWLKGSGFYN